MTKRYPRLSLDTLPTDKHLTKRFARVTFDAPEITSHIPIQSMQLAKLEQYRLVVFVLISLGQKLHPI